MGEIRNGARSLLNLLAKGCKMSKLPGFRNGVAQILGPATAESFFVLWDPLCAFVDLLIAGDNYFNQIDSAPDHSGDEDVLGGV